MGRCSIYDVQVVSYVLLGYANRLVSFGPSIFRFRYGRSSLEDRRNSDLLRSAARRSLYDALAYDYYTKTYYVTGPRFFVTACRMMVFRSIFRSVSFTTLLSRPIYELLWYRLCGVCVGEESFYIRRGPS